MIRKQRLRTTGRHFERANKGETGERKKEKGRGWGRGKRREEGGSGVPPPPPPPPFSLFSSPQFLPCSRVQNGGRSFVIAVFESFPPQNRLLCRLKVTDDRCGSFPSSERSRCQIFWNMFCPELLQRYWLFVKNFAIFCSQLAL